MDLWVPIKMADPTHGAGTQRPTARPAGSVCSLGKANSYAVTENTRKNQVSGKFETPLKEITPKIQFSGFVPKISRGEPAIQGTCFTAMCSLYMAAVRKPEGKDRSVNSRRGAVSFELYAF